MYDHYIVLRDSKGWRTEARRHVVQLLEDAKSALAVFAGAPGVFTLNERPISTETFHHLESHVIGDAIEDFAPKRLRSGVETALASLAISREVRARSSRALGWEAFRTSTMTTMTTLPKKNGPHFSRLSIC